MHVCFAVFSSCVVRINKQIQISFVRARRCVNHRETRYTQACMHMSAGIMRLARRSTRAMSLEVKQKLLQMIVARIETRELLDSFLLYCPSPLDNCYSTYNCTYL